MKCRLFAWIAFCVIMVTGSASAHGDLHDRIMRITAEIQESPSAGLFFKRGLLHLEHGEAESALADLSETERLSPGALEIDPPRAEALMLLGKDSDALEVLYRCLDREPSASRCLLLRARVFVRMGKKDHAVHDYRKTLSLVSNPEPDLLLEVSKALVENKQDAEALEVLDQGIARLGPLPPLVSAAVEIDVGNGNIGCALTRIDIAQAAAPRPEPWMASRASILARVGRTGESKAAWKSLLDRISSLPPNERSSHAMCSRAKEARDALAALNSNPP